MRIVVFSSNYPPLINPRAFRMGKFVKSISQQSEVLVITSQVKGVIEVEKNVIRCGFQMKQPEGFRDSLKRYAFFRFLHKLLWPDDKLFHQIFYLLKYLFKHRKKDDHIITVSNPFSSHLIGLVLKIILKHKWEVDIGDIFYDNQHHSFFSKSLERLVLQNSEHIIINSEFIRDHFCSNYKLPIEKFSIISNGVQIDVSKIKYIPSKFIRLGYIGNTYKNTREAIAELNILIELAKNHFQNKIRIQLFGNQFYKVQKLAKEFPDLIQIGYCMNEEELIQAYSNIDLLINFANKNNPGIPSKLKEYELTGLPIINFIYSSEDPSRYILNSTSNPVLHVLLNQVYSEGIIEYIENIATMKIIDRK